MAVPRKDLGGKPEAGIDAIQHIVECWEALSPFHKSYYSIKARFLAMNIDARALFVVGMIFVVGLVTLVFKVQLFAAIVIIVLSALLGVFAVWLIERPKQ